jgi:acetone carboxylase gamma subunit
MSLLGSGTKDLVVHRLHAPPGGAKTKHVAYHGMMKYKCPEESRTENQRKGILKNSSACQFDGSTSQKLDVSKIQCVLKKRKTSANEKQSNSSISSKSQKKVKFDDKINKLTELGNKYAVDQDMRTRTGDTVSHIRQQHQIQRVSVKPTLAASRDHVKSSMKISNVYDLRDSPENRTASPRSHTKSTSTNSGSLNCRTSGESYPLIHNVENDVEDFVRMEFCEDGVIPIYNPREATYHGAQEQATGEVAAESSNRLIENGIPVFTKTGKFVRTTRLNNYMREKKCESEHDENPKSEKPSYRLAAESKRKDKSNVNLTESKRMSSAQKSSVKTTTNTAGGAKITRSSMKPFMFTRFSADQGQPTSHSITDGHKNFCDDGKTYDIIRWLTSVKEIQSTEGFSSLHIEHGIRQ